MDTLFRLDLIKLRYCSAVAGGLFLLTCYPVHASKLDFTADPLVVGSNSIVDTVNGVTATTTAYSAEFANGTSTIYGPYTTGIVGRRQVFGTQTSGASNPGLGLLSAQALGQVDDDLPSGGIQPGFDNLASLRVGLNPPPTIQFALLEFDRPVNVSQVIVDDVSNFGRNIWAAGGAAGPDLSADLVTAFNDFDVFNSADDAGDGVFIHDFNALLDITYLAVGTTLPRSLGDVGPFDALVGGAQYYLNGIGFENAEASGGGSGGGGGGQEPDGGGAIAVPAPGGLWLFWVSLIGLGAARQKGNFRRPRLRVGL